MKKGLLLQLVTGIRGLIKKEGHVNKDNNETKTSGVLEENKETDDIVDSSQNVGDK